MTCSHYVANFSDYLDGTAPRAEVEAFEAHLEGCEDCRRYREVVARGSALLKALPEPQLSHDFMPRLQHRIYHANGVVGLGSGASATPAMTVLSMAVILTAIAWLPALVPRAPQVELAPIVVDQPPADLPARPIDALPGELPERAPLSDLEGGLWDDPSGLMYEYSPLSQRYGQRAQLRRTGLQRER